jgi:hypothetical protein
VWALQRIEDLKTLEVNWLLGSGDYSYRIASRLGSAPTCDCLPTGGANERCNRIMELALRMAGRSQAGHSTAYRARVWGPVLPRHDDAQAAAPNHHRRRPIDGAGWRALRITVLAGKRPPNRGRQGARPTGLSRARVAERITRWADVRCARESGRIADIRGCRRVTPKRTISNLKCLWPASARSFISPCEFCRLSAGRNSS